MTLGGLNNIRSQGINLLTKTASNDGFLARWTRHMAYGVAHALGAEPIEHVAGQTTWRWFGTHFTSTAAEPMLKPKVGAARELTVGNIGGSLLQGGLFLGSVGLAAATGGIGGAMHMGLMEISLQGALARHAYSVAGNGAMHAGRSVLATAFKTGSLPHMALNQADFFARMAGGMFAGYAASHMLGGGMLGSLAAPFAASWGVKTGPKLAMPALVVGAAALVGYGAYSVARNVVNAGYNHAQMKKSIQTSGDMAAFSTQGANTMRARAVMTINKSQLNARSALGMEANYMSFPSRSYHSRYKQAY